MLHDRYLRLLPGGQLKPGDIFLMRFPYGSDRRRDGEFEIPPGTRPCLLLSRGLIGDTPMNIVAPGVSPEGRLLREDDIVISDEDQASACGLYRPTMFRASHRLFIATGSDLFERNARIGRLGPAQREQFEAVEKLLATAPREVRSRLRPRVAIYRPKPLIQP
ncbi:MAG: hypothetical protein H5U24_09735 [Thioclava marina]|uniref:Uncharacterized protein n=2 Tax=Thioclava atlantica TaxID=1317124 RepID=A0A085TS45_9RHOB|nr:hypothetical protein [Thioclava marina]KFE33542.1 hypothetical protein DW2_17737 [Thioclava atlantica]MBC7145673.1 hypothetical protein [Thioclava marina]